MDANLALLGSLPRGGGFTQVRVHWMLELLALEPDSKELDFSTLDRLVHRLWRRGMAPGFELMGNPGGVFADFDDPVQVVLWREVVAEVAGHYVERYGEEEVARWNFEAWNEPDHQ